MSSWICSSPAALALGLLRLFQRAGPADIELLLVLGVYCLLLVAILPDHRYFLPIFPAAALAAANGLAAANTLAPYAIQVILLALLFCAGALYLFVDWTRASHVFFHPH